MKKFRVKSDKIGKQYCDLNGCIVFSDKLSQKKLKELYEKGCKAIELCE
jgi:hypothetical protein